MVLKINVQSTIIIDLVFVVTMHEVLAIAH